MILHHSYGMTFQVMDDDGKRLGGFEIEHHTKRLSSIHTHLRDRYIGKGFGRQMYDEAEKMLGKMGRVLVPSPSLSPCSTRFWQKRAPHLLKYHTEISHNGGTLLPKVSLYRKLDPNYHWSHWWYYFWKNYGLHR